MSISIDLKGTKEYFISDLYQAKCKTANTLQQALLTDPDTDRVLGWRTLTKSAVQFDLMKEKAMEIREKADVFVIVGVGGSNQAARAMIEALKLDRKGPEIIYLGNTLSSYYISKTLEHMEGKSV